MEQRNPNFFARIHKFASYEVGGRHPPLSGNMASPRLGAPHLNYSGVRNWMVDEDSSNDKESSSDFELSLPSPSIMPFFPRKRRDARRERRARTTFTSQQTQILESEYRRSEYISRPRRYEVANQLSLKEVQIKIWYQNRRAKDKRIEKASWDRQCRCLGLAAAATTGQFPVPVNYRLSSALVGQLTHPMHMFPSSTPNLSFPFFPPLHNQGREEMNKNQGNRLEPRNKQKFTRTVNQSDLLDGEVSILN